MLSASSPIKTKLREHFFDQSASGAYGAFLPRPPRIKTIFPSSFAQGFQGFQSRINRSRFRIVVKFDAVDFRDKFDAMLDAFEICDRFAHRIGRRAASQSGRKAR